MASSMDSGRLLKHRRTGQLGVSGLDPYGVCAGDEVAITFATNPQDPNKWLGNGYPQKEWEVVKPEQISRYARKKFGHLLRH